MTSLSPRRHKTLSLATAFGLSLAFALPASAEPRIEKTVKVDAGLYELAVSASTGTVYVAATGTRGADNAKIISFDGKTLAHKGELDVSKTPLYGLGINDKTQTLYGTDTRGGDVVAIDLKANKVVAVINEGQKAHVREAVIDEAANKVYVSVYGGFDASNEKSNKDERKSAVWVIDGSTNKLANVINNPAKGVAGIALDPANKRAYFTDLTRNEVVAVDLDSHLTLARWPSGGERATNLAIDTAGQRLFVTNQKPGNLGVIDIKTGQLVKTIETGDGALSVAYSAKNNQVYVTNRNAGTLTVIDAKTYAVLANLKTGTLPQTVVVDSNSGSVYVTNKARGLPRNAPADAKPIVDENGDTLVLVRP